VRRAAGGAVVGGPVRIVVVLFLFRLRRRCCGVVGPGCSAVGLGEGFLVESRAGVVVRFAHAVEPLRAVLAVADASQLGEPPCVPFLACTPEVDGE